MIYKNGIKPQAEAYQVTIYPFSTIFNDTVVGLFSCWFIIWFVINNQNPGEDAMKKREEL